MKTPMAMLLSLLILAAGSSFAAETKLSKEDRQKMADVHTKMAECLMSDKSMSECHTEMMKAHKSLMGKDGSPMMGHMKNHAKAGKMHDCEDEASDKE